MPSDNDHCDSKNDGNAMQSHWQSVLLNDMILTVGAVCVCTSLG